MAFRLAPSSGRQTSVAITVAFAVLLLLAMPMFYFYGSNASSSGTIIVGPSLSKMEQPRMHTTPTFAVKTRTLGCPLGTL